MVKCNYCGSTAQVKFVKEEERKDYIVKYYKCGCGNKISIIFKKTLDKSAKVWYNIIKIRELINRQNREKELSMRSFKTLWVVSIDICPEYVTTTREKAFEWLADYIRSEKYEEQDTEKVIAEINKHSYVENVFNNRFYAIDEVLYED